MLYNNIEDEGATIKRVEQRAREYWSARQKHALQPPTFTLTQDPPPASILPPNFTYSSSKCIPIRLDLEADNCRLREAFLWRPDDPIFDASRLAAQLSTEFDLDRSVFVPLIQQSLSEQVQDHVALADARRHVAFSGVLGLLHLDIVVGNLQYADIMQVDLAMEAELCGAIGEQTAAELRLPAEFGPAIAFCMLEQLYQMQRALLAAGWAVREDGQIALNSAADPELAARLLTVPRPGYGPVVVELSAGEVEKLEVARERDGRRKRRQTRSRRDAWALGSPPKLHRTPISISRGRVEKTEVSGGESEGGDLGPDDEVYRRSTLLMHHSGTPSRATSRRRRGRGRGRR